LEGYKTIKELADDLNVSKDKIKYQVRKLPRELPVKIDGVTYLNSVAISTILNSMGVKIPSKKQGYNPPVTHELPSENIVDLLKKELKKKDSLLVEKDMQINKLLDHHGEMQKLLDQQQQLTLQSNKQIEKLQNQLALLAPKMENEEEDGANEEPIAEEMSPIKEQPKKETPFKFDSVGPRKKWWQLWK